MKRLLLLINLVSIYTSVASQNLLTSKRKSHVTIIYKLTDNEALELRKSTPQTLQETFYHTPIDSYPTDSGYRKELAPGHYLYVTAMENELQCELESIDNLEMLILNNHRDMQLVFLDLRGHEVKTLRPEIGSKIISFDKNLNVYRIPTTNRQGIVSVLHEGHTNFFQIGRQYNNTFGARTKRRILYTFPVKQVLAPFRYLYRSSKSLIQYGRIYPPPIYHKVRDKVMRFIDGKEYEGFMVLNKPKYKPGDTVKMKAFVTTRKGRPIKKTLELKLSNWSYSHVSKKIVELKPYRPGCYATEFVLTDSLNLLLDKSYSLRLDDKRIRHNYLSGQFQFEQYELKQNNFFLRALETELTKSNPKVIFLRGTDSNEMPLFDVSVNLLARTKSVSGFYEKQLFIPDTLWKHTLKLDPLGETRVAIPDSIFLNAAYQIELSAIFRNAENETQTRTVDLKYDSKSPEYESNIEGDSVFFSSDTPGETVKLVVTNADDEDLRVAEITLPYAEKLNQNVFQYKLLKEYKVLTSIDLGEVGSQLEVMAQRTRDSLFASIQNPRRIFFRYQLFKNNRIFKSGSGQGWAIKLNANPADRYYLSLQFVWAGKPQEMNYDLHFAKKILQLSVAHEPLVYPGQQAEFNIELKDAYGEPVPNADITAHAWTKKFKSNMAVELKDYESFKDRKAFNVFHERDLNETALKQDLNYEYWKSTLGLDSAAYYQFLYPSGKIFQYAFVPENGVTQIAPFVVKDGAVQTVHYIYFNRVLQYYNQVNNPEPYSFKVPADSFDISMRLTDRLITLKSVKAINGQKLILSVAVDSLPANAISTRQEMKFTSDEVNKLQSHFLWIDRKQDQRFAYFTDGIDYRMLDFNNPYGRSMVGPFYPGYLQYHLPDHRYDFDFKSNRVYQFNGSLIDRDCMSWPHGSYLQNKPITVSFRDLVLTREAVLERFKDFENTKVFESHKPEEFYRKSVAGNGSLDLKLNSTHWPIKAIFLLNLNNPDEYYIYPASWRTFRNLTKGPYQVVIIYRDGAYLKPNPIVVQQHGQTLYDFANDSLHTTDSFSEEVLKKLFQWTSQSSYGTLDRDKEMQGLREQFYQQSYNTNFNGHWITGVVTDDSGSPMPGVNVVVKGTTLGTVTDVEGNYQLYAPYDAVLVISFIGYSSQEVDSRGATDVQLQPDVTQLSEVVVVGYASVSKSNLTASVSTVHANLLQGRIAGVQVNGYAVAPDSIMIRVRGAASLGAPGASSLIVVDGVVMSMDDLDPARISRVEILKSEEATAIYGARAANGVILVSTKTGISRSELLKTKLPDQPMQVPDVALEGSSLRKRFSDYAFWQPKLTTDENGKVSFKATFPDDITAWNVNVIALANQKRSTQIASSVRSFKPLLAQLAVPNFLIEGDSTTAIGKITNYSSDSLHLNQRISIDNRLIRSGSIIVSNSKIDTIDLVATGDSIAVQYEVKRKGYADGELRKIPVFKQGVSESKGLFVALLNDTTFTVDLSQANGEIFIHAEADLLDVLLDEVNQLKIYPYDCNEQTASKLVALLAEKQILQFKKEKFTENRQIEKAIKKLINNQNQDGGWGWWDKSKSSLWISRHVAGALNKAKKLGFNARYDQVGLIKFLEEDMSSVFPTGNPEEILKSFIFLAEQGEKVNAGVVDTLRKHRKLTTAYDNLLAQRLLQVMGSQVNWEQINLNRKQTLRGNWYWGERNYWLWNNDVDNTLLVYKLMEAENPNNPNLTKLRNYFLEQRSLSWRNTFESAQIIETIMPGLLKGNEYKGEPSITITGVPDKIAKFPFQLAQRNQKTFTVTKTGTEPVYFTAYYKEWNAHPEKVEKDFIVQTKWTDNVESLQAGKQTKLEVSVNVEKDADYVMISVPIPAGCSYASKPQSRYQAEVYREYDVHETRIYCERMKAGTYHYEIPLTPRYKGTYTLNPAKAEWMYFPVKFGRNGISKTVIR